MNEPHPTRLVCQRRLGCGGRAALALKGMGTQKKRETLELRMAEASRIGFAGELVAEIHPLVESEV